MEEYILLAAFRTLLASDLQSEFCANNLALMQGYTIEMYHHDGALNLIFNGPDDKMHILLQKVLSYIIHL